MEGERRSMADSANTRVYKERHRRTSCTRQPHNCFDRHLFRPRSIAAGMLRVLCPRLKGLRLAASVPTRCLSPVAPAVTAWMTGMQLQSAPVGWWLWLYSSSTARWRLWLQLT